MMDVQIGKIAQLHPKYLSSLEKLCQDSIKTEDMYCWKMPDIFIAKAFGLVTITNEESFITFEDIVKRIRDYTKIDKQCIIESLHRLLRHPPEGINGVVVGVQMVPTTSSP